jgi:hypothetical protein
MVGPGVRVGCGVIVGVGVAVGVGVGGAHHNPFAVQKLSIPLLISWPNMALTLTMMINANTANIMISSQGSFLIRDLINSRDV